MSHPLFRQATFSLSAAKIEQLPADRGYEVAFAGRSNAGKSSVLNVLCGQDTLARTSKTPGRTQQLNVFLLDNDRRLIDLPGYGFAKVPAKVKIEWQKTLDEYLQTRESLKGIILIMDIRHPLKDYDQLMVEWSAASELPVHILLNKSDKLTKGAAKATELEVRAALASYGDLVTVQTFSAMKKYGVDQCYPILDKWLHIKKRR